MTEPIRKAVVLARGLGTRMRAAGADDALDAGQRAAAGKGYKALMPVGAGGETLLDHVLRRLREAGFEEICLVVAPEHEDFTRFAEERGVRLHFAVQTEPRGTADAVAAAEAFAGRARFVVVNSDNLYPVAALAALRGLDGAGLVGFRADTLVANSNIPAERIAKFAIIDTDANGDLARIIEKPEFVPDNPLVSMNCWAFGPSIFDACRAIGPSPRGEFELTAAVMHAVETYGEKFRVVVSNAGVLDLSSRADVASVAAMIHGK